MNANLKLWLVTGTAMEINDIRQERNITPIAWLRASEDSTRAVGEVIAFVQEQMPQAHLTKIKTEDIGGSVEAFLKMKYELADPLELLANCAVESARAANQPEPIATDDVEASVRAAIKAQGIEKT